MTMDPEACRREKSQSQAPNPCDPGIYKQTNTELEIPCVTSQEALWAVVCLASLAQHSLAAGTAGAYHTGPRNPELCAQTPKSTVNTELNNAVYK